ncbi:hypothetical protein FVE67_04145 [Thermosulfurimonas marina]|uniref:Adenylate kinase n=1 Tax=Thermosulfurimonas marina TaxID=2047767 RepID=A0A6H1WSA2_9BACT|nr:nucleoside monophosphate kinase [Thermosulfurimonas marina]QJA06034.1 hypothetical protein FVE67_04145 [Thermosulfurimonas marina]
MKALHLLGPTGAGKSPLGQALEKEGLYGHRALHFDFGAELRRVAAGEGPPEIGPEEVEFVRRVLAEGLLLEDEHFPLAEKILRAFLWRKQAREKDLLILNGLPRHLGQARDVLRLLDLRVAVELRVDEKTLWFRLRKDPAGDRKGRPDDTPELVARKLSWYRERTRPLLEFYLQQGIPVFHLPVGPEDTGLKLLQKLRALLAENLF